MWKNASLWQGDVDCDAQTRKWVKLRIYSVLIVGLNSGLHSVLSHCRLLVYLHIPFLNLDIGGHEREIISPFVEFLLGINWILNTYKIELVHYGSVQRALLFGMFSVRLVSLKTQKSHTGFNRAISTKERIWVELLC